MFDRPYRTFFPHRCPHAHIQVALSTSFSTVIIGHPEVEHISTMSDIWDRKDVILSLNSVKCDVFFVLITVTNRPLVLDKVLLLLQSKATANATNSLDISTYLWSKLEFKTANINFEENTIQNVVQIFVPNMLTPLVVISEHSRQTWPIMWLQMPWLLVSPGHRKPWYQFNYGFMFTDTNSARRVLNVGTHPDSKDPRIDIN